MRLLSGFSVLTLILGLASAAAATEPMRVTVERISDGKRIPAEYAVCLPTKDGKSDQNGQNLRPTISWSGAPAGTKSFAIFVMDPDVPADFTDAGKDGKTIPAEAKRQNFFHYGVLNIPTDATSFPGGASDVKPAIGLQLSNDMGHNHYVKDIAQYGGPCPPWNDERLHHYHFIVLALMDEPKITASNGATANSPDTAKMMYMRLTQSQRVLGKGEVVGTYTLNPKL